MLRAVHVAWSLLALGFLPSCARVRVSVGSSKALKEAALDCHIVAFQSFMPPATARAVVKQDEDMRGIHQKVDDLYALAQKRFGGHVHRTKHGMQFDIDGADPRWSPIFGPQWEALKSGPGPLYFTVNAEAEWTGECEVVRRFDACLGDSTFCTGADVESSMVQMRQSDGAWRLVLQESPEQRAMGRRLLSFLRSSVDLCGDELRGASSADADEDVLVRMATKFMASVTAFTAEMRRASAASHAAPATASSAR
jgi:hypothetical protein